MFGARCAFIAARDALDAGHRAPSLEQAIERLLGHADEQIGKGDVTGAADPASKALHLLFHPARAAQIAPGRSPEEDRRRLEALRRSRTGSLLMSGDEEEAEGTAVSSGLLVADETGPALPISVLVVGHRNLLFADRLVAELSDLPELDLQRLDLSDLGLDEDVRLQPLTRARLRGLVEGERLQPPRALADKIEQADVILAEWGNHSTAYMSMLEGVGARSGGVPLVSRVHRFEIDTAYFHLVDLQSVDHWLFIAPHIRDRALRLRPIDRSRTTLVANINDLERFTADKDAGAERTLLHTDWSRSTKDVDFAFDVLERLHEDDRRWKLLLVGSCPTTATPHGRHALERVSAFGDRVEILGRSDDIPSVLRRAGFVVSTSLAEGSHEVVAEGAAAACVPVVRDWPENRADGGASGIYPPSWVIRTPLEAAQRILDHADPDRRADEGSRARSFILRDRDPARIRRDYCAALRRAALRGR